MSRAAYLLLLILLAGGAAAGLLLGDGAGDPTVPEDPLRTGETDADATPAPARVEDPGGAALAGSPGAGRKRPKRRRWPVISTDKFPRGTLEVTPLAPDETPYPPQAVTIRLEREQTSFWAPPLGVPDYESGTWRFEGVPIGKVRVVVFGDHVIRTERRAEILADRVEKVDVFADRGGAIHYRAKLYSGDVPTELKLRLLEAGKRTPVSVYWQVRMPDLHTGAHRATEVVQAHDGYVFAIPEGRYVLWAESPEGEIDQVDLEVKLAETTEAEILLRK